MRRRCAHGTLVVQTRSTARTFLRSRSTFPAHRSTCSSSSRRTLHNTLCAATAMRSTTKTRQSQRWTSWMPPVSGTMSSAEDASRQTPAGSKYTAIPTAFPGRAIPDMTLQVRACPVFSCTRRSMAAPYSQLHVSGDPVIGPLFLFSDLLAHHPHTQLRPARRRSPMRL